MTSLLARLPPLKKRTAQPTVEPSSEPRSALLDTLTARADSLRADPYAGAQPCRVLVADWPWAFGDKLPGKGRGAEKHYEVMGLDEIGKFPLPPILDDAVLFFWRVGAGNDKGSLGEAAYGAVRSWGFTPKSELVWRKTRPCRACAGDGWTPIKHAAPEYAEVRVWCDECHGRGYKVAMGMGHYVRGSHEICLIATRGKPIFPTDKGVRSIFDAHVGEHSAKPERFYEKVMQLYPEGPYTELFARRRRPGWQCFGDELPPEVQP